MGRGGQTVDDTIDNCRSPAEYKARIAQLRKRVDELEGWQERAVKMLEKEVGGGEDPCPGCGKRWYGHAPPEDESCPLAILLREASK